MLQCNSAWVLYQFVLYLNQSLTEFVDMFQCSVTKSSTVCLFPFVSSVDSKSQVVALQKTHPQRQLNLQFHGQPYIFLPSWSPQKLVLGSCVCPEVASRGNEQWKRLTENSGKIRKEYIKLPHGMVRSVHMEKSDLRCWIWPMSWGLDAH